MSARLPYCETVTSARITNLPCATPTFTPQPCDCNKLIEMLHDARSTNTDGKCTYFREISMSNCVSYAYLYSVGTEVSVIRDTPVGRRKNYQVCKFLSVFRLYQIDNEVR